MKRAGKGNKKAHVRAAGRKRLARRNAPSGSTRVRALVRAQEMNEMLKRSIIESEALQSSGDDRPWGEDHISDLLNEEHSGTKLYRTPNAARRGAKQSRKTR